MVSRFKTLSLTLRKLPQVLDKLHAEVDQQAASVSKLESQSATVDGKLKDLGKHIAQYQESSKESSEKLHQDFKKLVKNLENRVNDLADQQQAAPKSTKKSSGSSANLFAENNANDSFYRLFEDTFRGSEAEIKERLTTYLPYFSDVKKNKQAVLDIGCGRGELLELLGESKIEAHGVDLNERMIEVAKEKGLNATQADANDVMKKKSIKNLGAITGFHIVEHIPFEMLITLLKNCYRALPSKGFVIFETPNPENLVVASHTFYMDPSHLNPVPPALLAFALEYAGFEQTEVLRLHPKKKRPNYGTMSGDAKAVLDAYYGAQDYAVIARKD